VNVYPIFTIRSGRVTEGTEVGRFNVRSANVTIPAVIVGEAGRGRELGIVPIQLPPALYQEWQESSSVVIIKAAAVGQTRTGRPKLIAADEPTDTSKIIAVFRTYIGFRGSNSHTGDRTADGQYLPFPGELLASGTIAQGTAGRMGRGGQLVAVMPQDVIFRTGYSGRLYGAPSEHFYVWTGTEVLSVTAEERELAELF